MAVHENRLIDKTCEVTTAKHSCVLSAAIGGFIVELILFTARTNVISVPISCFVCYNQYI